jgi:3-oxoacyl-[acyl-carrier protein] reductase
MPTPAFADLSRRQAVVTGASSGIGRAIALELAAAGADVLVHYAHSRRDQEIAQLLADLRLREVQAVPVRLEFDLATDYAEFVERCWTIFPRLDIWVNNAGVDLLTGADAKLSYDLKLQRLFEVDVRSTILLSRIVGQKMKSLGRGVILNIGWDQADRGMEGESGELFAAAKNAVMGASRSFAVTFAPEVRVNCIAPGWIQTAWGRQASQIWHERVLSETPLRRWGRPEDVAKLARFLVSDDADFLTGQVINANGGAVR